MVQYHKFLVVAQRQRDGRWKILRDASLPASKEAWDGAVRSDGLKYDG
jgi:ketosteroid isomerase-like protein